MRLEIEGGKGHILVCDRTKRILYVETHIDGVWDFNALKSFSNENGKNYSINLKQQHNE